MPIYITHCSYKKDDSLKHTNIEVTPDKLYTSKHILPFMRKCMGKSVNWAIFSDLYGVWFPSIKHKWYEEDPNKIVKRSKIINPAKFWRLVSDFDQKLRDYDEIWFYLQPGRPLHCLYEKLLKETRLKNKVKRFNHISKIDC